MSDTITIDGVTMKPGMHFTVPAHGFFAGLIRFGDRLHDPHNGGKVAHAVVYVGTQPNGYDCIQAEPHGVGWTTVAHWQQAGPVYPMRATISDDASYHAEKFALTTVGWPYGYIVDAFIGLRELFGIDQNKDLVRGLARVWPNHTECAQLADLVLTKGAGMSVFKDGRLPGDVQPGDLWRLYYNNKGPLA